MFYWNRTSGHLGIRRDSLVGVYCTTETPRHFTGELYVCLFVDCTFLMWFNLEMERFFFNDVSHDNALKLRHYPVRFVVLLLFGKLASGSCRINWTNITKTAWGNNMVDIVSKTSCIVLQRCLLRLDAVQSRLHSMYKLEESTVWMECKRKTCQSSGVTQSNQIWLAATQNHLKKNLKKWRGLKVWRCIKHCFHPLLRHCSSSKTDAHLITSSSHLWWVENLNNSDLFVVSCHLMVLTMHQNFFRRKIIWNPKTREKKKKSLTFR